MNQFVLMYLIYGGFLLMGYLILRTSGRTNIEVIVADIVVAILFLPQSIVLTVMGAIIFAVIWLVSLLKMDKLLTRTIRFKSKNK